MLNLLLGGVLPQIDDTLFVNREAMHVTAVSIGATTATLTVVRGIHGTEATEINQLDPYFYISNPIPQDREVEVYELDLASMTEAIVWRGVVESTGYVKGTIALQISCRDQIGKLSEKRLGGQAFRATATMGRKQGPNGGTLIVMRLDADDAALQYAPLYADNPGFDSATKDKALPVVVDDAVLALPAFGLTDPDVRNHPRFNFAWIHSAAPGEVELITGSEPDADLAAAPFTDAAGRRAGYRGLYVS